MADEEKKDEQGAPIPAPAPKTEPVKKTEPVPTSVTLDDYLSRVSVHMGLVASFRYEARSKPELLKDKTDEQWVKAFQQQSETRYE
ncbi:hypothetical protein ACIFOE_23335 [Paenibacillus sp. NRS-1783]|uniref:hypothetical protein n=1 Tax=Paenibacillus sp. NRS-1783 TaxID=3233907 RepID=UPI003D2ABCCC